MLLKYLFLAGIPLVFGWQIRPEQPSRETTCNCNCNFPKPMSYFDPYQQQAMMCIPVPINIRGIYPQNTGRPGYPTSGSPMIEQRRSGNKASPASPNPGGLAPAPGQQPLPGAFDRPASPDFIENTPEHHQTPMPFSDSFFRQLESEALEGIPEAISPEQQPAYMDYAKPDLINDYIID